MKMNNKDKETINKIKHYKLITQKILNYNYLTLTKFNNPT